MKDIGRLAAIGAVLLGIFAVAAILYTRGREQGRSEAIARAVEADPSRFERAHSPVIGPADATVTVVEFMDPECETCARVYPLVKQMLERWPGRVRLVMRYMPFHQNSVYAAGALEAAREQGRFTEMLEALFAQQRDWGSHDHPRPELIPGYARKIGLDMDAFETFMDAGTYRTQVEIDRADGIALEVAATPTFFVNRKPLPESSLKALHDLIEAELAGS